MIRMYLKGWEFERNAETAQHLEYLKAWISVQRINFEDNWSVISWDNFEQKYPILNMVEWAMKLCHFFMKKFGKVVKFEF